MDEKIKCECGESAFWWFGGYVRCPNCYNELKHDPSGQTWMRKFNFNENKYIENWEHWGNAVSEKERKLEQQLKEANDLVVIKTTTTNILHGVIKERDALLDEVLKATPVPSHPHLARYFYISEDLGNRIKDRNKP